MMSQTHPDLNANQFFLIYKLAISTKHYKLIDISMQAITQLVLNNFLDGNCEDNTYDINIEEFKEQLEQKK